MNAEELFEDLKEMGLRSIDCDQEFAEQHMQELLDILLYKKMTSSLFYAAIKTGAQEISIKPVKEYINASFDTKEMFLYAYHKWFMIIQWKKKRVLLYKIIE